MLQFLIFAFFLLLLKYRNYVYSPNVIDLPFTGLCTCTLVGILNDSVIGNSIMLVILFLSRHKPYSACK